MNNYLTLEDLESLEKSVDEIIQQKNNSEVFSNIGQNRRVALVFLNPSLRTRLSTQIAAEQLGMKVSVIDFSRHAWPLEFELGTRMTGNRSEHIKEASMVLSKYCDIIAVRSFAELKDRAYDQNEVVLNNFKEYSEVPIVNMESSTAHPLQALADAITIKEQKIDRPKVVISWSPHPRALPHAVPNSLIRMAKKLEIDISITNPVGYDLDPSITNGIEINHNQKEAFKDADLIYSKNWASFSSYGKILDIKENWMIDTEKMALTNKAKFMHCLPIRRNVVATDNVLDSPNSIVSEQVENRIHAARYVLEKLISHE